MLRHCVRHLRLRKRPTTWKTKSPTRRPRSLTTNSKKIARDNTLEHAFPKPRFSQTSINLTDLKKLDIGTVIMNIGAISGLVGFMMSDVLHLRLLSITGSLCGITYNITRNPRQINACLWGGLFATVNAYMTYKLLQERNAAEPQFNVHEMELWQRHFKEYGVKAKVFKKMVSEADWHTYRKGEVIVPFNIPLDRVHIIHDGQATVFKEGTEGELKYRTEIYKLVGRGRNGCIVGGTALVEPKTAKHPYPLTVEAETDATVVVSWDRNNLKQLMRKESTLEAAFIHTMYVDLISGLRRSRRWTDDDVAVDRDVVEEAEVEEEGDYNSHRRAVGVEERRKVRQTMGKYRIMLKEAINTREANRLDPRKKRAARMFAKKNKLTLAQHVHTLHSLGWNKHQWEDGGMIVDPSTDGATSTTVVVAE